jgi:hypothetical protein
MQVHEESGAIFRVCHGKSRSLSNNPSQFVNSPQSFGRVQDRPRMRECRFATSHERLEAKGATRDSVNDGLKCHPQTIQAPVERTIECSAVSAAARRMLTEELLGLLLDHGQSIHAGRLFHNPR